MENISFWVHKRAFISPDRIAMSGKIRSYTYVELSGKINEMAILLKYKYHLEKGDRIAILANNREEYIIAYFSIAQLGLVAVPLNIRLTAKELEFQVRDSGVKAIIYETETAGLYKELSAFYRFESALSFDDSMNVDVNFYPYTENQVDCSLDPYIICYTSGTTGRPKGAVLTQENMFWNAINNQTAIDITSKDKTIVLLPLFHIGGIGLFAFPTIFAGGEIVVPGKFNPDQAIKSIEENQVTLVMGVPAIHDAIRKSALFETANFDSVRWFYSGGAPCPEELIHTFLDRGLPFGQGFGMTETSPTIFMLSKEDYKRKAGSIGKPALYCEISIVDDEGHPVAQGEIGELLIKGPHVMKEYWGLPDVTENTIRNGWLHSGDLIRQDEEGFVYMAGRKKDMIISGGENVYPLEVEQVMNKLKGVNESAVIGVEDKKWGEVPIAFVSLDADTTIKKDDLLTHCKQQLGKYKVPKQIIILKELPKNAAGKIDKKALNSYEVS